MFSDISDLYFNYFLLIKSGKAVAILIYVRELFMPCPVCLETRRDPILRALSHEKILLHPFQCITVIQFFNASISRATDVPVKKNTKKEERQDKSVLQTRVHLLKF
jgi:hypothetical protein